jgi:hypothetical protein
MAALPASMKHKLRAHIAAHDGKAKSRKTALCCEHGFSVRMSNAIAIELQRLLNGMRELPGAERKDVLRAVRRQQG